MKKLCRRLSDFSVQRQMRRAEDETQMEIRKKLSYIALAFAALLMIMSVVAIFLDGVNGGRFLGSVTYSILVILLSFRAIFPPRIEKDVVVSLSPTPFSGLSVPSP